MSERVGANDGLPSTATFGALECILRIPLAPTVAGPRRFELKEFCCAEDGLGSVSELLLCVNAPGLPNISLKSSPGLLRFDLLANGSNWLDDVGAGEDRTELDFLLKASVPTVRTSDCSVSGCGDNLSSKSRRFVVCTVVAGPQGSKSPNTDFWGAGGLTTVVGGCCWGLKRGGACSPFSPSALNSMRVGTGAVKDG